MKVVVKVANYVGSFIKVLPSYCELLVLINFFVFVSTIAMTVYLKYSTLQYFQFFCWLCHLLLARCIKL